MRKSTLFLLILCNAFWMNCDSCFNSCNSGPFFGKLNIKVTLNEENTFLPIEIYEGNFDDGTLIIQDTIPSDEVENGRVVYDLEAGFYYSAAVIYQSGAKTIIAIDGSEMKLEVDDCNCDYPTDLTLNARLAK